LFIGGPGTNKTELSKLLAEKTGRTHISMGQVLRDESSKDTDRGKEVAEVLSAGNLVSAVSSLIRYQPDT